VIGYHPRFSPSLARVRTTVRQAHKRKLRVLLFPIVRLVETHGPNEWRGTLRPSDRAAWLASYGERLEELAKIAAEEHVAALAIGSELSSLDGDGAFWAPLVQRIRVGFPGELVYSANWDRFEQVGLWALVDRAGVCAYFPLAQPGEQPRLPSLIGALETHKTRLGQLSARIAKPVILTELGYRSQPNALAEPWDEGSAVPVDAAALEAQRLGFAAFRGAFTPAPAWLDGFYVWNWYGWGGKRSRGYTPVDKPAMREVERLLEPAVEAQPAGGSARPRRQPHRR